MTTRRTFLTTTGAAITLLPFTSIAVRAEAHSGDRFETSMGDLTVFPIDHASFVMQSQAGTTYVDPVGGAALYEGMGQPTLILITHEHGDHYDAETLAALDDGNVQFITNPAVYEMLTEEQQARATQLANGESTSFGNITYDAIPAYNTTQERLDFHPQGRDNGYVVTMGDFRIYISGDTEDTPEMRALEDIDLAFVCMNLPFTMSAEAAASAVSEFAPTYVYPYHYRGRDNGTQDPMEFANMLTSDTEAKMGGWYES